MAAGLEPMQHHDLDEGADMEGICGCVEADIGGLRPFVQFGIERAEVGALMDESTFG